MNDPCRQFRHLLGGYALGQLTSDEQEAVRLHLETCPQCNDELDEITVVARLLPSADPERVLNKPVTPPHVAADLFAKIAKERRLQRRRRSTAGVALGIAAAILVGVMVVPLVQSEPTPGDFVAFQNAPADVSADARLVNQPWGTEVHLKVDGLSGRQTVWFEQPDGTRASAGSFDGGGTEPVDLVLSTAFRAQDAVALCVSPPNAAPVLRAEL
jgi:anti-sigma factor RsiW